MNQRRCTITVSWPSIIIILLMLYAYTTSLWRYVYGSMLIRNMTLYIPTVFMLIKCVERGVKISRWQFVLLLAFCLIIFNNHDIGNFDLYYFRGIVALLCFLWVTKNNEKWMDSGLKFICLATVIFAVFTIWFSFDVNFYKQHILPLFDAASQQQLVYSLNRGASAGLTKHYSINGTYLTIGCIALISQVIRGKRKTFFPCIALVLTAIALLLTGKRAHIVFLSGSLLIGYYFYNSAHKKGRIFKIVAAVVVACVTFVVVGQFIPSIYLFYNRFLETASSGDISLGRIEYYYVAFEYFLKNPILGIGWGGYKFVNTAYTGFVNGSLANTHNVYLQLLCEVGLTGFVVFLLAFIWLLVKSIKLLKSARSLQDDIMSSRMMFSVMLQIFFLLYCMTGNPLYDLEVMTFYIFSASITLYYYKLYNRGDSR